MNALRPFFILTGRASVIWIGILAILIISLILSGISSVPGDFSEYVDIAFFAALVFPAVGGALLGAVIQDFQQTTFAILLPNVRARLVSGFLVSGLALSLFITAFTALVSTSSNNYLVLFSIGIGSYCVFGVIFESTSVWIKQLSGMFGIVILARSAEISNVMNSYPLVIFILSLAVSFFCLRIMFSMPGFRRRAGKLSPVIPGKFSYEKSRQVMRNKAAKDGPRSSRWSSGYLGTNIWRWVRASYFEKRGTYSMSSLSKGIAGSWGLVLIVLVSAWIDRGDLQWGEAMAWSINDALMRSPFQPEFGEKGGPFQLVLLLIAYVGAVTALGSPSSPNANLVYPLSRIQKAVLLFRSGIVDAAIFLFILSPLMLLIGNVFGWYAGFPMRLDFMPFFFRVMLITLILMPFGYMGRLYLMEAVWQKAENSMLVFGACIVMFMIFVSLLTIISGRLLHSDGTELMVLGLILVSSRLFFWRALVKYFRHADLA